jgi:hypothetical protein
LLQGRQAKGANIFADLEPRFPHDDQIHRRAVVAADWKLLVAPDKSTRLFDLRADPLEQIGAIEAEDRRDFLQVLLKVHDTTARKARVQHPPAAIELTRERQEQLKALGYLR